MLTDEELPPLPKFPGASTPVLRDALQSIARDYARAVEQAAYEAAIKACDNERVDAESTGAKEDYAYNAAIQHCADASAR